MRGKGVGWLVAVCAVALAACGSAATAKPMATVRATNAATQTAAATFTPRPTSTITASPAPPTVTPIPAPTQPPGPLPDDETKARLENQGFQVVSSDQITGPDSSVYRAYLVNTGVSYTCQLVIARWTGTRFEEMPATQVKMDWATCQFVDWDGWLQQQTQDIREPLGLSGQLSDINGNGWPELATIYNSCGNSCWNFDGTALQFFEIRPDNRVVELSAEVTGLMRPDHLLHAREPLTIYAFDPVGFKEAQADLYRIYAWEAGHFTDVSERYLSEYEALVREAADRLTGSHGTSVTGWQIVRDMQTILAVTDRMHLPRAESLATFLGATNPDDWTDLDKDTHCWLQYSRARAQVQVEAGQPFDVINYMGFELSLGTDRYSLAGYAAEFDQTRFDLSACLE